ncbi:recombinase [Salmonella enterica subsp. enterica serovar Cubana]|uniref:ERF family protein n=2 Tax=Salmonella enterica TaxID=28901 RepID=A0A742QS10_SALER|nr:recombinase [Salmonella enterica subsp. enterica serovar Poona]EAO1036807.1 recombinase [Salmonella enterica]EBP4105635.1 recombinase [Salmonella enterica subsp. enterica]EBU8248790.1 recombinase [Salmonella enterica subsp. enterica serovar Cubana]EBW7254824.1 recombinase [Salmonella enterica subsp. enterica serovar Gatow]EDT7792981.1 ERF family protein [Salmonella enterica subsp. enterica serovar Horsham]EDY0939274.1 ERF family protein [Salmonella enterica subsp. enterica serovar Florida]
MSKEFYARLAEIQEHLNAPKNQYNSFGKYKYRSCEDILEGVKPLLKGLFLSISDEIVLIGDRYYVKATATITDGENSHSASAIAREEENKKGMDAAQVTGATSSYARKYCLNGLFGIDDSKDADTDEHKQQQNAAPAKQTKSSPSSHAPEQVLKAFTEAAMQKNTVEELKQAFAKAWKMLEGTPEQHKAQDVYNIKRDELEGETA